MARDEELRRVAEDVRALARSLARDLRDAFQDEALHHGIRSAVRDARRSMRGAPWGDPRRYRRGYPGYGWWWEPPPWSGPGRSRSGAYPNREGYPPGSPNPSGDQIGDQPGDQTSERTGRWPDQHGSGSERPGNHPPGWEAFRPWGPTPAWSRPPWPRAPKPHRREPLPPVRRRWDATTVVGMLAVLFGLAWLLGALDAVRVPAEGVVAAGLMLLGASLIITGRTDWSLSRHSWPVWLGMALIIVLLATSSALGIPGTLHHLSFGNQERIASSGQTVNGGFGNLTVAADGLKAGDTITVESAAGETRITTPQKIPIEVHARVLGGQICVQGREVDSGVGARVDETFGPRTEQPLIVNVHQLFGQVLIGGEGCS